MPWVLQKETVTASIVGTTKPNHLEDAVAALSVKLDSNELRA
jgi:aryl-alcohol dehydrogenase-like predicted oxidoreductase